MIDQPHWLTNTSLGTAVANSLKDPQRLDNCGIKIRIYYLFVFPNTMNPIGLYAESVVWIKDF